MKRFNLLFILLFGAMALSAQQTFIISALVLNNNYQVPAANYPVIVIDSASGANPVISVYNYTTNANGTFSDTVVAGGISGKFWFLAPDSCGFAVMGVSYSTNSPSTLATAGIILCNKIIVNPSPNCNYTVSALPVAGFPNQAFFNYSGQGGSSYLWTFGDGTSSNQPNVFHTYAQAGTYTYCLQIDSCPPVCGTITVFNSGGCDPFFFPVTNGATVDIYPSLLTGQFLAIVDWGDGIQDTFTPLNIPSIPNTISHTYAVPGTYQICLTHSNAQLGCSNTACNTVIVTAGSPFQCNASFIIDTVNSQPGTVYVWNMSAVSGGSPNTIVNFIWDFGDGTTSNLPFPTHNYQNPGSYQLCLTMTAVDSSLITCVSTFCDSLTVDQNGNIIYKGAIIGWNLVVLNPASIGIDEDALAQAKIYPNPANDVLNIELPEGIATSTAEVFSVNGALLKTHVLRSGQNQIMVDNLPAGMYVIQLRSDASAAQIKFIKQ